MHSAIILPLIVYNNDEQVYVAVCSAIYHIMSSTDCNGACITVLWVCTASMPITGAVLEELAERAVGSTLEGLREHRNNHICLEWGCRALRTLIMDRYVTHCHIVCNVSCSMSQCVSYSVTQCVMLCVISSHIV